MLAAFAARGARFLILALALVAAACSGSPRGRGRSPGLAGRADPATDCAAPPDGEGATLVIQDGHADQVRDLALSADGRVLASVGDDGTVRIWDTRTGVLVRRLKAAKEMGARSHVALSDAGDVLAYPAAGPTVGVLDLASGKELGRLPWDHRTYALSPDGTRVAIVVSAGVNVHDTATGALVRGLSVTPGPDAVAFDRSGRRIAVAGMAGVAVFDAASGATTSTFPAPKGFIEDVSWSGDVVAVHLSAGAVHLLGGPGARIEGEFADAGATSERIFTSGKVVMLNQVRQGLRAWDGKGRPQPLPLETGPVDLLAVSADGSTLAVVYNEPLRGQAIRILDGPTLRTMRTLEGSSNAVQGLGFSSSGEALITRSNVGLRRWSTSSGELESSRPPGVFMGTYLSIAWDPRDRQVVVSSGLAAMQVLDPSGRVLRQWMPGLPQHFVQVAALAPNGTDLYTATRNGVIQAWSLAEVPAAPPKPPAPMAELARPPERAVAKLPWSIYDGALSKDGRALVVGSFDTWRLASVDLAAGGAVRWEVDTLKGAPRWLETTADGRVLVCGRSASGPGGALMVHSLATGALEKTIPLASPGPLAIKDGVLVVGGEHPVLLDAKTFAVKRELVVPDLAVTAAAAHPKRAQFALGGDSGATAIVSSETGETLAILVATSSGEYVTATPEGPYRASIDGARAVAWSFTGPLEGFSFDQFAARFARPDIVKRRLAGEKAESLGPVARPPRVCVDRAAAPDTAASELQVEARVAGAREVTKVRVFVNGRLAGERPVGARVQKVSVPVPLGSGKNRLSIIAYDADGYASNPALVDAVSTAKRQKPDLWVVSLGVSRYTNLAASQQLDFADDDARAVARAWSAQRGASFGEVHATTLTDAEVTVESAEKAIGALAEMRPDDLAVVFLAGHGVRVDDGQMVFLTSDASATRTGAREHGLGWKKLGALLAKARGRVLVLLDACHSGHVSLDDVAPNDALAAALSAGDRGGVLVFAASRGGQLSYEVSAGRGAGRGLELAWEGKPAAAARPAKAGHGLFTGALLEALSGDAPDRDRSGAVELSELVDYVTERVRSASNGKQTPWVARREMFGDYVVAPSSGKR